MTYYTTPSFPPCMVCHIKADLNSDRRPACAVFVVLRLSPNKTPHKPHSNMPERERERSRWWKEVKGKFPLFNIVESLRTTLDYGGDFYYFPASFTAPLCPKLWNLIKYLCWWFFHEVATLYILDHRPLNCI